MSHDEFQKVSRVNRNHKKKAVQVDSDQVVFDTKRPTAKKKTGKMSLREIDAYMSEEYDDFELN